MLTTPELPDDIDTLKTALTAERAARQQAEARASGAEAMVAHLKLLIAKMKHDRFGQSAERGRKLLDQLELQLEELEASAAEDAAAEQTVADTTTVRGFARKRPVRAPLPAHLPRERVVVRAERLPVLWRQAGQAGRGRHRDHRGSAAPVEGDPDSAQEV